MAEPVSVTDSVASIRKWLDYIEHFYGEVGATPPASTTPTSGVEPRVMAWGAKVSPTFRDRVRWIEQTLKVHASDLMSCMAWESGETFSASVTNKAGSGATGLIQFMPSTAASLGTTTAKLSAMTAEDQLSYVYKYFLPFKGKLNNLGDVYMAILWPKAVGRADDFILFNGGIAYRQNAGLDHDKDGNVTRGECLTKIKDKLAKGMLAENVG